MKLGFVSAILAEQPLEFVLDTAEELGYDCVEVMCWPVGKAERRYAGVTHIDCSNPTSLPVDEIQRAFSSRGVMLSGLGYYPNLLTPVKEEAEVAREHLMNVIECSAKLGVYRTNTFIGRDPSRSVDDQWDAMLAVWEPIVAHADKHNVKIGIENCPMFFTADEWPGGKNLATTPKIWRRLFADLKSPNLGLNYDPSHLVWQMMDPIAPLMEFKDRLHHVHAKDARIDRDRLNDVGIMANPLEYHLPKLPGFGEVNWGRFFSVLTDTGYTGPVCVEVEDRAYEQSLSGRLAALKRSHTYLRQFVTDRGY